MSLCAPFAASRWTDIWRLFYPEMAILTLEKASRAYRTLRGAFLISENGITHFGRASPSSILKWQYSLQVGKLLSRYNAASFYLKMAIVTSGVASRV